MWCGAQLTEKDEEVLKHLTDISVSELAPEPDEDGDEIGGFKLIFHFSANPFFSHTELVRMSQSLLAPLHPYRGVCKAFCSFGGLGQAGN